MATVRLPVFQRLRPDTNTVEMVRRLENNVFEYAKALTGERGVLQGGVLPSGRVLVVPGVMAPTDWRDIAASEMLASWQLYPTNGAPLPQYRLRVRKGADGMVECIGLTRPPAVGTLGSPFAWPTGYAPAQEEIFDLRGELQAVEIRSAANAPDITRRETTGVPAEGWVSFSGMRFRAASEEPIDWPEASKITLRLREDFPGEPAVVRLDDAVTDAGLHVGPCPVRWSAVNDGRRWLVTLHNILGLPPGGPYTLKLAVLTA